MKVEFLSISLISNLENIWQVAGLTTTENGKQIATIVEGSTTYLHVKISF